MSGILDSVDQETCDKIFVSVFNLKAIKGITDLMKLTCTHGGENHANLLNVFAETMKDMNHLLDLLEFPDRISEKEEIRRKILRTHRALLDEQGNSKILKEVYAHCANMILLDEVYGLIDGARIICRDALDVLELVRVKDDLDEYRQFRLLSALHTIETDQQLFVHVSKRISCKCLRPKIREAGVPTAKCERVLCKVERPCQQMGVCPFCHISTYCSVNCMHDDWETHKTYCIGRKLGRNLAPLVKKESGKS